MPRNKLSEFDQSLREQISKNLKQLCESMTQSELSELTGIPESTISGYFAMRSTPNAGNVQKIADALGVKKSDIDPRFSPDFLQKKEELTRKDEREIESDLEDMMNSVAAAAFEDGSDLEDIEAFKLGHALYTPKDNTQWLKTYTTSINADRVERVANEFAVELLLNDEYLLEHNGSSIYKLAECRGVPQQFVRLKKEMAL